MRLFIAVLVCVGVGTVRLALADPPSQAPAAPAATTSASAPAPATQAASTAQAAPAAAAKPVIDLDEKNLVGQGYKAEMHHGQKVFCRREQVLGSRLGGQEKHCATLEQLKVSQQSSKEEIDRIQRSPTNPQGH